MDNPTKRTIETDHELEDHVDECRLALVETTLQSRHHHGTSESPLAHHQTATASAAASMPTPAIVAEAAATAATGTLMNSEGGGSMATTATTTTTKVAAMSENPFYVNIAEAVAHLMKAGNVPADVALKQLKAMVAGVMGRDRVAQARCTNQFRRLLSHENPPIQGVVELDVVPRFVQFLQRDNNTALQIDAAWALTNIASGSSEHIKVVLELGAIPALVRLLNSRHDAVRHQVVWALGNIAGDSPPCRDLVLQAGAMRPLLTHVRRTHDFDMLRTATWLLLNLCRGSGSGSGGTAAPKPDFALVAPAIPILVQLLLSSSDDVVVSNACWALSFLPGPTNHVPIQAMVDDALCRRLVELLGSTNAKAPSASAVTTTTTTAATASLQVPALRIVGNIVTGDDVMTQRVIQNKALPSLLTLLSSPKRGIRKEACWTISNITAGNTAQIQAVMDNGMIPALVELLGPTAEFDIRKEAVWAIYNAARGGNEDQVKFLIEQGCVRPLCDLLSTAGDDVKLVALVLAAVENMLEVGEEEARVLGRQNHVALLVLECGGVSKMDDFQEHPSMEIRQKSLELLETYFIEGEDEMEYRGQFDLGMGYPHGGFACLGTQ